MPGTSEPELLDQALRELGPDTRDLARCEKSFDAELRVRRDRLIARDLELLSPFAIDDELAAQLERHPFVDSEQLADDRDRLTLGRLELRDRVIRVVVLERDPLDGTVEYILALWFARCHERAS
jgi:hypothetical protein